MNAGNNSVPLHQCSSTKPRRWNAAITEAKASPAPKARERARRGRLWARITTHCAHRSPSSQRGFDLRQVSSLRVIFFYVDSIDVDPDAHYEGEIIFSNINNIRSIEHLDNFPLIFLLSHFASLTICLFHPARHLSPITQQATTGAGEGHHVLLLTHEKPITTRFQTAL